MELEMEFCIVLEQTVLMMPQTCLQVDPKPVYQLSKLDLTDERTDERTNGRTDGRTFAILELLSQLKTGLKSNSIVDF